MSPSKKPVLLLLTCLLLLTPLLTQFSASAAASTDEDPKALKNKNKEEPEKGGDEEQQCSKDKDGNKAGGCRHKSGKNSTKLVMVQVIFRHGDRTPLYSWPKDPHYYRKSNSSIAQTFQRKGLLTKRGKVQAYELGQFLQTRYKEFLQGTWLPEDIHVQSSSVERAIMTAQTVLTGLFPPNQCPDKEPGGCEGRWSREIRWQPIPIYPIPKQMDNKINFDPETCPAFMKELHNVLGCDYMQQYVSNNQKMFDDLKEHTGLPVVDIETVGLIYDTLFIHNTYEMTMPNWTKAYYPSPLKEMTILGFQALSANREMMKFNGGPLLREVIWNMKSVAVKRCTESQRKKERKSREEEEDDMMMDMMYNQRPRNKKLHLISGHDTTVAGFLGTLGLLHNQLPAYTSAVIIELHEPVKKRESIESTNEYIVKVFYRNATRSPLEEMTILRCGNPCHLDNLEMISTDIFVNNWQKECEGMTGLMGMLMQPLRRVGKLMTSFMSMLRGGDGRDCGCK